MNKFKPDEQPKQSDNRNDLATLEAKLIRHILVLAGSLTDDMEDVPFNQRAAALNSLIDKLLKLRGYLAKHEPDDDRIIEIIYRYPDGTTHKTPPWNKDTPDESED